MGIFNDAAESESSLEKINKDIVQGKITITDALQTGEINLVQIQEWQSKYFMSVQSGKPWEKILDNIWNYAVQGWRKLITIPIFLIFFIVPAITNLYESSSKLLASITTAFSEKMSEMDASELDVCNENVIRVGPLVTREEANKAKEDLIQTMKRDDEYTWIYDVHIVRDIDDSKGFLLLIDTFSGQSDQKSISDELKRLKIIDSNGLGNKLLSAKPFFYSQKSFEEKYGKLSPKATKCQYAEL